MNPCEDWPELAAGRDTSKREGLAAQMVRDTYRSGRCQMCLELAVECLQAGRLQAGLWLLEKLEVELQHEPGETHELLKRCRQMRELLSTIKETR